MNLTLSALISAKKLFSMTWINIR